MDAQQKGQVFPHIQVAPIRIGTTASTLQEVRRLLAEIDDELPAIAVTTAATRGAFADIGIDFDEVDTLLKEVDTGISGLESEVQGWPLAQKRAAAADSREPLVLNVLSLDPNPVIRTLLCCNPVAPAACLRRIAKEGTEHMRLAIANNPSATSDVLELIVDLTPESEVLEAVKRHARSSPITRHRAESILESHSPSPANPSSSGHGYGRGYSGRRGKY